MSLIIGVRCADGIVVGADSAATFGGIYKNTIRQTARKLQVIDGKAIIGCAGPAGLAQRYYGVLQHILADEKFCIDTLHAHELLGCLHDHFLRATEEQLRSLTAAKAFLDLGALTAGLGGSVVAMVSQGKPTLLFFDELCNAEATTDDLPFVAIGSGQAIADPFLALLKRVLWLNEPPSLDIGLISTIWTLNHAIEVNPGGVAGPLHLTTLAIKDNRTVVDVLQKETIDQYLDALDELEKKIGETLRKLPLLRTEPMASSSANKESAAEPPVPT